MLVHLFGLLSVTFSPLIPSDYDDSVATWHININFFAARHITCTYISWSGFKSDWRNIIQDFRMFGCASGCACVLMRAHQSSQLFEFWQQDQKKTRVGVFVSLRGIVCVCVCATQGEWVGMKVRFCSETFDVEEQRLLSVCQLPTLYHRPNTWPPQSVCVWVSVCVSCLIRQGLGYVTLLQSYLDP